MGVVSILNAVNIESLDDLRRHSEKGCETATGNETD